MPELFGWASLIIINVSLIISLYNISKPNRIEKINPKNIIYYRDIPTFNLELAFWIIKNYGLNNDDIDFIGALLLKWLKEDKIHIIKKDNKNYLDFTTLFKPTNKYERKFYYTFLGLCGKNRILEEGEFINYYLYNQDKINRIFYKIYKEIEENLIENKKIVKNYFSSTIKVNEEIKTLTNKILGLKNIY